MADGQWLMANCWWSGTIAEIDIDALARAV
jgi:hypothetical protein